MAEKVAKEEGETPTSSSKLEEVDENDDHLNLLESDSSESESEGRRKKAEPEKKAKKEYKDERINKSLSELAVRIRFIRYTCTHMGTPHV